MMRANRLFSVSLTVVAIFAASCAARQTQPTASTQASDVMPSAPTDGDISTNDLLDRMHTLGETLTSLRANIEMETSDGQSGAVSARTGNFLLQKRGEGDSRARVSLEKLIIIDDNDKRKVIPEEVEYLLEGDWVIDRVYGRSENDPGGRRETRRQIRKPGEKVDLLKLGEGPFPLPIGQPRDSVRAQFEVTRLPDDPEKPGLVGLELRPREQTRLAKRFHQIVIWIDQNDAMPRIIETVSADILINPDTGKQELVAGTESKKTTLSDVKINQPVADGDFKLEPIDVSNWNIVTQGYEE
jgi:hypothetical protein